MVLRHLDDHHFKACEAKQPEPKYPSGERVTALSITLSKKNIGQVQIPRAIVDELQLRDEVFVFYDITDGTFCLSGSKCVNAATSYRLHDSGKKKKLGCTKLVMEIVDKFHPNFQDGKNIAYFPYWDVCSINQEPVVVVRCK